MTNSAKPYFCCYQEISMLIGTHQILNRFPTTEVFFFLNYFILKLLFGENFSHLATKEGAATHSKDFFFEKYLSILANLTLLILFSEMLKF
jgi:hypothetical protein